MVGTAQGGSAVQQVDVRNTFRTPPLLAWTGLELLPILWIAGGLIVLGGAALAVRRLRRPVPRRRQSALRAGPGTFESR